MSLTRAARRRAEREEAKEVFSFPGVSPAYQAFVAREFMQLYGAIVAPSIEAMNDFLVELLIESGAVDEEFVKEFAARWQAKRIEQFNAAQQEAVDASAGGETFEPTVTNTSPGLVGPDGTPLED